MLTREELMEDLHYAPETGIFTRIRQTSRCIKVGDISGSLTSKGYLRIYVKGKSYPAHVLAYLYMMGEFPPVQVDHINGIRNDNRWCNLRAATRLQNKGNQKIRSDNASGHKGVGYRGACKTKPWGARITINGEQKWLGYFATPEEAAAAYEVAAKKHFGEFARTK